jgi:hypothetical protein
MEFKHPKYYKELERIRKEFEASLKPEATSTKRQAASTKQQAIDETVPHNDIEEAATNCRSDDMSQE